MTASRLSVAPTVTFDPASLLRTHLEGIPPYEPVMPYEVLSDQLSLPVDRLVKLDANENPYGPPPAVLQALAQLPNAHVYPDPESRQLRRALAEYHRVPFENILCGAGADDLIDLLVRAFLEPGEALLTCPPTFGMYAFDARLHNAQLVEVPRREDFSLDLDGIEAAVHRFHPKLIFLATPNNPDGRLLSPDELQRLLGLPALIVLDEAYIEFAPVGASYLREAQEFPNLVVLRTFSKWAGLAGLRAGYGVFPPPILPALWKIRQPYSVSVSASAAACAALEHAAELVQVGRQLIAERQRLARRLAAIPWLQPYPSQANFILCRLRERSAPRLQASLRRQGILVRHFNQPGLQDCLRISVGRPEQNDALLQALEEIQDG